METTLVIAPGALESIFGCDRLTSLTNDGTDMTDVAAGADVQASTDKASTDKASTDKASTDKAPTDKASTDLASFAAGLPKAELHLHLEGTLEPELKFELAQRNGIALDQKTVEDVRSSYVFHDLSSFLRVYYPAMQVLQTAADFEDLAFAYLSKAASQGVRHVEMFFDPQAHTGRGVPFGNVVGGYRRAVVRAGTELDISAELILCMLRDYSAEHAMSTLMESLPYKDWIIGIGLDSDERNNPPSKFAAVFARARAEGYLLTMHCDIDQDNSIEHIRQVLEDIGVDRIDHGSNIVESQALMSLAAERGIGFTSCPVSNSFVTEQMKSAEIAQMLNAGLRVTVNSDDPSYFAAYVADNYVALAEKGGFSRADLITLARNSFLASWLPARTKQAYLEEIDAYVARLS